MRRADTRTIAGLVAAAVVACGGAGARSVTPGPAADDAESAAAEAETQEERALPDWMVLDGPQSMPEEVVATLVIGEPRKAFEELRTYWAAAGLGHLDLDGVFAQLVGYPPRGIDLAQPVRALLLDPTEFPSPLVLVVYFDDIEELAEAAIGDETDVIVAAGEGAAVIGDRDAVAHAYGYAVTTLVEEALPARPRATVLARQVVRRHRGVVDAFFEALAAEMVAEEGPDAAAAWSVPLLRRWVGELDAVELEIASSAEALSVTGRVRPRAGTTMQAFLARQPAASFAPVGRLDTRAGVAAFRFDWSGPEMRAFYAGMMGAMVGADAAEQVMRDFDEWVALGYEEVAFGFELQPRAARITMAADMKDGPRAAELLRRHLLTRPVELHHDPITMSSGRPVRHRGAVIHQLVLALVPDAPDETRASMEVAFGGDRVELSITGSGGTLLGTAGADHLDRARALLDAARGRRALPALPASLAAALDQARARRESAVLAVDLEGMVAVTAGREPAGLAPLVVGLSFADAQLTLHLTLPATQARAATTAQ